MKTVEIDKAIGSLADYVRRLKKEALILTRDGKPVAALVGIENADWETVALSTHPEFLDLIERSRARQKAEGGISSGDMRRRLGVKKPKRRDP